MALTPTLTWPVKDPNEILDYQIDWSDRLDGDIILTSAWEIVSGDGGLTIDSVDFSDTHSLIWLSAGTMDWKYQVQNRIETLGLRTMDQTVNLIIKAK